MHVIWNKDVFITIWNESNLLVRRENPLHTLQVFFSQSPSGADLAKFAGILFQVFSSEDQEEFDQTQSFSVGDWYSLLPL